MKKVAIWILTSLPVFVYLGFIGYNMVGAAKRNRPIVPAVFEGEGFSRIGVARVVITPYVHQWVTVVPREVKLGRFTSGEPTEFFYAEIVLADGRSVEVSLSAEGPVRDVQVIPVEYPEEPGRLELRRKGIGFQLLKLEDIQKRAEKG